MIVIVSKPHKQLDPFAIANTAVGVYTNLQVSCICSFGNISSQGYGMYPASGRSNTGVCPGFSTTDGETLCTGQGLGGTPTRYGRPQGFPSGLCDGPS